MLGGKRRGGRPKVLNKAAQIFQAISEKGETRRGRSPNSQQGKSGEGS